MVAEALYSKIYIDGIKLSIAKRFNLEYNQNLPTEYKFLFFSSRIANNTISFRKVGRSDAKAMTCSYWLNNLLLFYNMNMKISLKPCNNLLETITVNDMFLKGIKMTHAPTLIMYNNMEVSRSREELQSLNSTINNIKQYYKDQCFQEITHGGFQTKVFQNLSPVKSIRRFQLFPIANLIRVYNKFHGDKFIQFILKARMNLLGNAVNRYVFKMDVSSTCPKPGCNEDEWTSHITSACRQSLTLYTTRHNTVLNKIKEKLEYRCSELVIDRATLTGNRQRPDISLARFKNNNTIQIGEVTCVYDAKLQEKREFKIIKYDQWIRDFKQLHPETNPKLAVFVCGVLGTLDEKIIENLQLLQFTKADATKFAYILANYSMYKTYSVWIERCKVKWN
jgi:hypothetical protein